MNSRTLLFAGLIACSRITHAENATVHSRGECWRDGYTFNTNLISKDRFEQLLVLAPDKQYHLMPQDWVEACKIQACPASVHQEAFFENGEANQAALRKRIAFLKSLKAPVELTPIVDYYVEQSAFLLWVNGIRLNFYRTWKMDAFATKYYIKPVRKTLDPRDLCKSELDYLSRERDRDKKYSATQGGLNCLNNEFQRSVSYSKAAWTAYLNVYKVTREREGPGGACD